MAAGTSCSRTSPAAGRPVRRDELWPTGWGTTSGDSLNRRTRDHIQHVKIKIRLFGVCISVLYIFVLHNELKMFSSKKKKRVNN